MSNLQNFRLCSNLYTSKYILVTTARAAVTTTANTVPKKADE